MTKYKCKSKLQQNLSSLNTLSYLRGEIEITIDRPYRQKQLREEEE